VPHSPVLATSADPRRVETRSQVWVTVLGERHLGYGEFGTRCLAGGDLGHGPEVVHAGHPALDNDPGQLLADERVVGFAQVAASSTSRVAPGTPPPPPMAARSFINVVSANRPAAVDVTQPVGVGNLDIGEEHLVERGPPPGHLSRGRTFDPRCVACRR